MWTLPLRWAPLLTSFQSWTQVIDSPVPGLQVRASIWRLRFGKILCKLGQALAPSSPAPENTNTLSDANTQHNRALPVCSDTYPWFFLLLLCSTNSICGLLYLVTAPKPLLPLLTHTDTHTHKVKTVRGSVSTWAVSAHCFGESLGHNSYQDKSQGSFLPSSILFLPLPSWTADLAWFNDQLVAQMCGGRWVEEGAASSRVCLSISATTLQNSSRCS